MGKAKRAHGGRVPASAIAGLAARWARFAWPMLRYCTLWRAITPPSPTNPQLPELHWRPLRFQAQVPLPRPRVAAAGHLPPIHPEPHLAIDRAHAVVVPLGRAAAQLLARKAA